MPGAPIRLRCEYLENPSGVDAARPRLSWWLGDDRPAELQTAYQVLASRSLERLDADEGDLWDSGRVERQRTYNIEYRGEPLGSEQRVWWKVRSFDSDGLASPWSQPAYFETGLFDGDDWHGGWVGTSLCGSRTDPAPVPLLWRDFELYSEVRSARLYVATLGHASITLNGTPVTPDQLEPAWTDSRRRVPYRVYNVNALLRTGANRLAALLADGAYAGCPGLGHRQQFGDRPWLWSMLKLELADGGRREVVTDAHWRWLPSWILRADPSAGEVHDGRQARRLRELLAAPAGDPGPAGAPVLERDQVDRLGLRDVGAADLGPPTAAAAAPPLRVTARVAPVAAPTRHAGPLGQVRLRYDFGQNLVGRISLELTLPRGTPVRVRYAEALEADGRLPANASEDAYTCSGDPDGERFEPLFALHGFQYIEVEAPELQPLHLTRVHALAVHADIAPSGAFSSDHALLNQLHANLQWTLRCASLEVPAAGFGPNRRLGFTGPAQAVLRAAAFQHDVARFYGAWVEQLVDAQHEDGDIPAVVPVPPDLEAQLGDGGGAWSDALVICCWTLYRSYGDRRLLERHYPAILRFVGGLERRLPERIRPAPRHAFADGIDDLLATAHFYFSLKLAVRIAGVLGRPVDLERFDRLALQVRNAFRRRFVTPDGRLVGDSASAYTLALHFGLLDGDERRLAFDTLVTRVERSAMTLRTHAVAAPFLLPVLCAGGRLDLCYRLLLELRAPAQLHGVLQGATTLWDEHSGERSAVALAAVGEWLYTGLAGIDLDGDLSDAHNAYRRMRIQPRPPLGPAFPDGPPLRQVDAALDTVNGRYETGWRITESAFEFYVNVPCNCSVQVLLPDDSARLLVAGRHELRVHLGGADRGDGIPLLLEVS